MPQQLRAFHNRRNRSLHHAPQINRIRHAGQIGLHCFPECCAAADPQIGEAVVNNFERQTVQQSRVEMHELRRIEMRRCPPDLFKRKLLRQHIERMAQFDRIGGAGFRQTAGERQRLDAFFVAQRFE